MSSSEDGETDESLTKQLLNMVLENNAVRDTAIPFVIGYLVLNIIVIVLLIYISIRISLK